MSGRQDDVKTVLLDLSEEIGKQSTTFNNKLIKVLLDNRLCKSLFIFLYQILMIFMHSAHPNI